MRNAAILLALIATALSANAGSVTMKRPHIAYRDSDGVAAACAGPRTACTHILTDFYCGCEHLDRGWVPSPHIIAQPSIFSTSDALLRHEQEHIVDVQRALNSYAAAMMMNSFSTAEGCADFVNGESQSFSRTMKSIQRATIIKRDGIMFAGPPVEP
jgi:hypothetical protein